MGPTKATTKEFWWEREWRQVGDFHFMSGRVVAELAAADRHDDVIAAVADESGHDVDFATHRFRFLDPTLGLERVIADLCLGS